MKKSCITEKIIYFWKSDWTWTEKTLLLADALLFGLLLGWLTSPFRSRNKQYFVDGMADTEQ